MNREWWKPQEQIQWNTLSNKYRLYLVFAVGCSFYRTALNTVSCSFIVHQLWSTRNSPIDHHSSSISLSLFKKNIKLEPFFRQTNMSPFQPFHKEGWNTNLGTCLPLPRRPQWGDRTHPGSTAKPQLWSSWLRTMQLATKENIMVPKGNGNKSINYFFLCISDLCILVYNYITITLYYTEGTACSSCSCWTFMWNDRLYK